MELVEGRTLRAWLRDRAPVARGRRGVPQAGRGLAAAHEAGLVHRDFKPDNVLIGNDGTIRVADFGLAARVTDVASNGHAGTPRYMAPEQRAGAAPAPAMDQYSFCISLWEALFANLPDGGDAPGHHPASGRVPARLRAALRRGVAADPAARYPSMEALLAVLTPVSNRRGLALVCVGGAAIAAALALHATDGETCAGSERRLAGAWDEPTRAAIHDAFAASHRPYAEADFARVAAVLDDRASAWIAMRAEACEATSVRHEQSEALLDLRMACLDRRLGELRALTGVFAKADGGVVDNSIAAVFKLDDLSGCADTELLLAQAPGPADPMTRQRGDAIRAQLDRAHALDLAGNYRESLKVANAAVVDARAIAYPRVLGEALQVVGREHTRLYEDKGAQAALEEAMLAYASAKDDEDVADVWIMMMNVVGVGQSRLDDAVVYQRGAEVAMARARPDLRRTAMFERQLGQLFKVRGDFVHALEMQEHVLALQRRTLAPDDPVLANTDVSIGNVYKALGRYDEALAHQRAALALYSRVEGAEHPDVAGVLINISSLDVSEARYDEALAELDKARAIQERTLGPDHPDVATLINNRAAIEVERGRYADAIEDYSRALVIRQTKLPAGHIALASTLRGRGIAQLRSGHAGEAETDFERALAIYEAKTGPKSPRVVEVLVSLGDAQIARGKLADAAATFARATTSMSTAHDAASETLDAQLATATSGLALLQGRADDALADARRALALLERWSVPGHPEIARAKIVVAEALLAGGHTADAAVLLTDAVTMLEAHPAAPDDLARAKSALARSSPRP